MIRNKQFDYLKAFNGNKWHTFGRKSFRRISTNAITFIILLKIANIVGKIQFTFKMPLFLKNERCVQTIRL